MSAHHLTEQAAAGPHIGSQGSLPEVEVEVEVLPADLTVYHSQP